MNKKETSEGGLCQNPWASRLDLFVITGIALSAFVLALGAWLIRGNLHFNTADTYKYDMMAVSLLEHGTLGKNVTAAPGYAVFLAMLYTVFGKSNLLAASLVNLGLFAILVFLVGTIGIRLFGRLPGYLAATALAINPDFLFNAHFAITEMLFTVVFMLLVVVLIRYRGTEALRWLGAAIILSGLAVLIRKAFLLYLPGILICLLWPVRDRKAGRLVHALIFLFGFLAITGAWSYRSSHVAGRLVVITDQGYHEFSMSNNADYLRYLTQALFGKGVPPVIASWAPPDFVITDSNGERSPSGFRFVFQYPLDWIQLYLLKLYYHLQFFNLTNLHYFIGPAIISGLYWLGAWALALLFLVRGHIGETGFVCAVLVATNFLVHPLLNIEPYFRFRLPVEPFIVLLSAGGVSVLYHAFPNFRLAAMSARDHDTAPGHENGSSSAARHVSGDQSRWVTAEKTAREFYEDGGWEPDESGTTLDARLWEDLRPCAAEYVAACRRKLLDYLPKTGRLLLDAASGPIQYPEYIEYSDGFSRRVCLDISLKALRQARAKLGPRGMYVCAGMPGLPFSDNQFDVVISLHTTYHIEQHKQEAAVRELIRVVKPGSTIIIVYANPDRLSLRVKRWLRPNRNPTSRRLLYYHAYPLGWWRRFADQSSVRIVPWRTLVAQESRIIPGKRFARLVLRCVLMSENWLPGLATRFGAYPMIILTKVQKG